MAYNLEQGSALTAVFAIGATAGAALTGLSGAATTFSTSAFNYAIDGNAFHNAAVTGGATPTTDAATGQAITLRAGQARAIVWVVNAAGTELVLAGPVQPWAGTGDSVALPLPVIPPGHAPFAVHALGGLSTLSGTFTFGVGNWNVTGLSIGTVRNICQLPNAPVVIS